MKERALRQALDSMAELAGVAGCALVEVGPGMVWHAAGQSEQMHILSEAASDYWRLYKRLDNHFTELGDMRAAVFMHVHGRITLIPCGKDMLLVALTHEKAAVDWSEWQNKTKQLAQLVDQL